MAAPSWLRRLSESDGEGSFQIPTVSLQTVTSSLRLHPSRKNSASTGNIPGTYRTWNKQTVDGIKDARDTATIGWRQNRTNDLNKSASSLCKRTHDDGKITTINAMSNSSVIKHGTGRNEQDLDSTHSLGRIDARRFDSWSYVDSEGYAWLPPSVHTSVSYGEFEDSSISSGSCIRRDRNPDFGRHGVVDRSEKKGRRKQQNNSCDESRTSEYNSYNERSDFSNACVPYNGRERETKLNNYSNDKSKTARLSKYPRRHSEDGVAEVSHKRYDSKLSVAESDLSSSSKDRNKRNSGRDSITSIDPKTQKVSSIGNVAVTVTNNIQYDPNDPFSFIQPVDLQFHAKMRKCLGPVMAVLLLLILAAALGAAIYFASALKDNQANQIDMLSANLAMKIRNIDHFENIEELSTTDFMDLSTEYCKNMDLFYTKSQFGKTYRGCEVVSIKDSYINFTLFFVEEAATSSQIVKVLESSAASGPRSQLAQVDKFALELDTVQVKMERKLEPETFNKKIIDDPSISTGSNTETDDIIGEVTKTPTLKAKKPGVVVSSSTTTTTPSSYGKKKTPTDKPVYSWDPCTEYDGMYFPHPTQCDMFIQCTNGQIIEQRCTQGLLYHWKQLTCVSRFTRDVVCPDPNKAPPRPTTATSSISPSSTAAPTTSTTIKTTTRRRDLFTTTLSSTTKQFIPDGVVLTAIAGQFSERPKYSANPCENEVDIQLYPHPADCAMFIQCVNGEVQNMHCAKGLVFDPNNSACIFPTDNDLLCPDIRPCQEKDDGYFPHPFDCSKFIQCQFKKETVLKCQKGLVWSITVNSCVHKTKSIVCPLDPKT